MINTTLLVVTAILIGVKASQKQSNGGYQPTDSIDTSNPPKQK